MCCLYKSRNKPKAHFFIFLLFEPINPWLCELAEYALEKFSFQTRSNIFGWNAFNMPVNPYIWEIIDSKTTKKNKFLSRPEATKNNQVSL